MSGLDRFSSRASDYARGRPGYPAEVVEVLAARGFPRGGAVADLGSGTGILARLFQEAGAEVVGVEPNAAMRAQALGVRMVAGTAERTGLPGRSVDLVTAAQAFHWFEVEGCRREWARILRPGGLVAIVQNQRVTEGDATCEAYEAIVRRFAAPEYAEVRERWNLGPKVAMLGGRAELVVLPNRQVLDEQGLRARAFSSSYLPAPGTAEGAALGEALAELARRGPVVLGYRTEVHVVSGLAN